MSINASKKVATPSSLISVQSGTETDTPKLNDVETVIKNPWYSNLTNLPVSEGSAVVTADTAAHTKGAWTEIIASNATDTPALFIFPQSVSVSGTNTATLLDIGTGAAGSETVVAGDIAIGGTAGTYVEMSCVVPIKVTQGTRIAARIQSIVTGGKTATIELQTLAWGDASTVPTSLDVLGTSTATSAGTSLGTSYTEIVASTAQQYEAIIVVPSISSAAVAGGTSTISVATGSTGNETEIATYGYNTHPFEYVVATGMPTRITDVTIPVGTRLSAKSGLSNVWVTLIGVPST